MKRLLWLLIGVPVAVLLIVLSVANRHPVQLRLDPFDAQDPALAMELPFFLYLFASVFAGMAVGGIAVWISQGRHRRAARQEKSRADTLGRQVAAEKDRLPAPDGQSRAA